MWKKIRIAVLLLVLASVAHTAWRDRRTAADWRLPLTVVLYPINADGSETVQRYLAGLDLARFDAIEAFVAAQAARRRGDTTASSGRARECACSCSTTTRR